MVYIVIYLELLFLFWGTLMFAFRSTGERSLFIPLFYSDLSTFTFGGTERGARQS